MVELMSTDGVTTNQGTVNENPNITTDEKTKEESEQADTTVDDKIKQKDFIHNGWCSDLVRSEDDLRNGSFKYVMLKGWICIYIYCWYMCVYV